MRLPGNIAHVIEQGGHWLLFGHALTVLGQFALIKLLAVSTNPAVFGQFSIVMLIVAAMMTLMYGPLTQWFMRFTSHMGEAEQSHVVLAAMNAVIVLPALIVVLPGVLVLLVMPDSTMIQQYLADIPLVPAVAFAMLSSLNNLCSVVIHAAGFPRAASLAYVAASWSRVIAVALAVAVCGADISAIIMALLIGQAIVLVAQYLYTRTSVLTLAADAASYAAIDRREMLRYVSPFILWSIPAYIAMTADRWVVSQHVSIEQFAQYAAMTFVTFSIVNAFNAGYERATVPIIFRISGDGSEEARVSKARSLVTDLLLLLAGIYLLGCLIYFLMPEGILGLLTTSEYTGYADQLWLMMLAASAFGVAQFIVARGLIEKRPGMYMVPKLVHSLAVVVLLILLVPEQQVEGAVISVLAANLVYLVMVVHTNSKLNREREALC